MNPNQLVAVIDDAPDYCSLVEAIFKRYVSSYLLSSYTSGQVFLDTLLHLKEQPNLILLDQHMPQLSGYQTLIALKQQPKYRAIPIVMMSADASHSEIKSFYEAGATAFMPKSTDFNALKETLLAACQYASKQKKISE